MIKYFRVVHDDNNFPKIINQKVTPREAYIGKGMPYNVAPTTTWQQINKLLLFMSWCKYGTYNPLVPTHDALFKKRVKYICVLNRAIFICRTNNITIYEKYIFALIINNHNDILVICFKLHWQLHNENAYFIKS